MAENWLSKSTGIWASCAALTTLLGCHSTPVDPYEYARSPAPLRMPAPDKQVEESCYEDSLTGGHVFAMYCASCHNPRSLAERPFSNYKNVAAHMRVRANLTGKEYAKLEAWLRRWHDVPPPNPPVEPSPTRFYFSQPIPELRDNGEPGARQSSPRAGGASSGEPGPMLPHLAK